MCSFLQVASIPCIDHTTTPTTTKSEINNAEPTTMIASSDTVDKSTLSTIPVTLSNNNENNEQTLPEDTIVVGVKACDDIRYKKYFKMMQFGVPATAVKLKMDAEGIDPTLLEYVLLFEFHSSIYLQNLLLVSRTKY